MNMTNQYKILALDLDGTLLDAQSRITPENARAVRMAQQAGVQIVLCSGGNEREVRSFTARRAAELARLAPVSGAAVQHPDDREPAFFDGLSTEMVDIILDECAAIDTDPCLYTTQDLYYGHAFRHFLENLQRRGRVVMDEADEGYHFVRDKNAWRVVLADEPRPFTKAILYHDDPNAIAPLTAALSVNQKITGRDSEKDVRHVEIDLGDSGLRYQPGDALGVWYQNDPALVKELVELLWLKGDEPVTVEGKTLPLNEALQWHFELTVNTANIVENYATLTRSETLLPLVGDKAKLQHYAATTPIVDMVRFSPAQLDAEALINLLRPLTPRLYSIASSQAEVENEVHVTVGVVRYDVEGRARAGGASSFLADRVEEEGEVRVFIEHNDNFRLPTNPETPVIMIGPGTGIAPFRAFMQQRAVDEAPGKNWLFFGNPHFTEDFLYQVEWQRYVKEGVLTRIDLAWSRDQQQKIYVQDKLREQGAELWRWINDGAHIYVCGDANRMAKDVEQALLEVIAEFGGMDTEAADEFLSELRVERRYQRDVY